MDNEEDKRGYDLKVDNFKRHLLNVINSSNINISTAYYVVKDICRMLESEFNRIAAVQYEQFCEDMKEEQPKEVEEDKAE